MKAKDARALSEGRTNQSAFQQMISINMEIEKSAKNGNNHIWYYQEIFDNNIKRLERGGFDVSKQNDRTRY